MTGFQKVVPSQIGAGLPGELAFDGPYRAQPALIRSASAANNVFGRAFTFVSGATGSWAAGSAGASDPKAAVVEAGGNGAFAGILVSPKEHRNVGSGGDPLAANYTLPNETMASFANEGSWWVQFAGAVEPGDAIYFHETTGALLVTAPGAAVPANASDAGIIGVVGRYVLTGAGVGVALIEPVIPALPAP